MNPNVEKANAASMNDGGIGRGAGMLEGAEAHGHYFIECRDAHGNLKWSDEIENLVVTQGKNDALDKYLSGSAYTAVWYLGLIGSTGYSAIAAGDTAASHAGWTEDTSYSQVSRPTASFAAASDLSAGGKATDAAVAESGLAADLTTGASTLAGSAAEAAAASDLSAGGKATDAAVAESGLAADLTTGASTLAGSAAEAASALDASASTRATAAAAQEAGSGADQASAVGGVIAAASEAVSAGDSGSAVAAPGRRERIMAGSRTFLA